MYKRSGFTLLETMIALAVIVMAIGAGATMSRVIFAASQQSEDLVQATDLADEGLRQLQLTQQYLQNTTTGSKNLGDYLKLPDSTSRLIVPYATSATAPLTIKWCVAGVGTAGAVAGDITCYSQLTKLRNASNATMTVGEMLTNGMENVAVHRDTTANVATDTRLVLDATTTSGSSVSNALTTWDRYTRSIMITPMPSMLAGTAVNSYRVTVTVQNIVSKVQVVRTILLTDSL
jgi:prepilin-type N-terminal cleavage/methylation domain-containing protein